MNKLVLFKSAIPGDETYTQLVRVSGEKDQESFFRDLKIVDVWWNNEVGESDGEISEDSYIDKLREYGWTVEYIFEELEVSF